MRMESLTIGEECERGQMEDEAYFLGSSSLNTIPAGKKEGGSVLRGMVAGIRSLTDRDAV
jgi:hypothetical protein